jgi:DNA-binding GntR family transcriptional regulator
MPGDAEEGWSQHGVILDRVVERDGPGARDAMAAHLRGALRSWRRLQGLEPDLAQMLARLPREDDSVARAEPGS